MDKLDLTNAIGIAYINQKYDIDIFGIMEIGSKISGKAPLLSTNDIAMFSGLQQDFVITKAKTELGFNPKTQNKQ